MNSNPRAKVKLYFLLMSSYNLSSNELTNNLNMAAQTTTKNSASNGKNNEKKKTTVAAAVLHVADVVTLVADVALFLEVTNIQKSLVDI